MQEIVAGNFASWCWRFWPTQNLRVVNWNIDRGLRLPEVADFLKSQEPDLLTLQEADLNARRTHRLNIAEELARRLSMNYVFGIEFEEMTQGTRTSPAYHGQTTLSRWPLRNSRIVRFRNQSEFWRPRWFLPRTAPFQERLGARIALVTELDFSGKTLAVYNCHLESRGNDALRLSQLAETLDDASARAQSQLSLIAGDLNFDVSGGEGAALVSRKGFRNVFADSRSPTRPAHNFLGNPRAIDWALISGPAVPGRQQVHTTIKASDHYPISFSLQFP